MMGRLSYYLMYTKGSAVSGMSTAISVLASERKCEVRCVNCKHFCSTGQFFDGVGGECH